MKCIDIELEELPCVPFAERHLLPHSSGVYLALDANGVVLYAGQSQSLRKRVESHHRLRQFKDTVSSVAWYLTEDRKRIERALIKELNPLYNRTAISVVTTSKRLRIGVVLHQWRMVERVGLRAVAREMGLSTSTLSRIERGESMDAAALIKILNWLLTAKND